MTPTLSPFRRFLHGFRNKGPADTAAPQLGFDEQAVELAVDEHGEARQAPGLLGDEYVVLLQLFGWQIDRVRMGFEVRAVGLVRQRSSALQLLKGIALFRQCAPDPHQRVFT